MCSVILCMCLSTSSGHRCFIPKGQTWWLAHSLIFAIIQCMCLSILRIHVPRFSQEYKLGGWHTDTAYILFLFYALFCGFGYRYQCHVFCHTNTRFYGCLVYVFVLELYCSCQIFTSLHDFPWFIVIIIARLFLTTVWFSIHVLSYRIQRCFGVGCQIWIISRHMCGIMILLEIHCSRVCTCFRHVTCVWCQACFFMYHT